MDFALVDALKSLRVLKFGHISVLTYLVNKSTHVFTVFLPIWGLTWALSQIRGLGRFRVLDFLFAFFCPKKQGKIKKSPNKVVFPFPL